MLCGWLRVDSNVSSDFPIVVGTNGGTKAPWGSCFPFVFIIDTNKRLVLAGFVSTSSKDIATTSSSYSKFPDREEV
jgi:hypothetical protein